MDNRFEVIYERKGFNSVEQILVDKETGVHYLFHGFGYGGGLTPLLGPDGNPIVHRTY